MSAFSGEARTGIFTGKQDAEISYCRRRWKRHNGRRNVKVAASHGHQVMMYDIASDAIFRAIDGIRQRFGLPGDAGKLTEETCGQISPG